MTFMCFLVTISVNFYYMHNLVFEHSDALSFALLACVILHINGKQFWGVFNNASARSAIECFLSERKRSRFKSIGVSPENARWLYSVQIRDVGRFLPKFNPWTNTFGNRLVRLHCSRIHPPVKLSQPKVYTCSLIVAVSWKISVSNYWSWIWSAQIPCLKYVHTCILNMYVYLKLYIYTTKTPIFDNEIYNHTSFIVL